MEGPGFDSLLTLKTIKTREILHPSAIEYYYPLAINLNCPTEILRLGSHKSSFSPYYFIRFISQSL